MVVLMHAGTCSCVGREQAQAAAAADREQVYRTVAFEVGVERFHVGAELGSIHHHPFIRVPDLSLCASRALGLFFPTGFVFV